MISKFNVNILFLLNAGIVGFLSIGAIYFTLLPMILWELTPERVISATTQNVPMIGLWLIYFVNIIFLPITRKKRERKWQISYIVFLIGFVIFVLFIIGALDCGQAIISKSFGMEYNERIGCVNEN